MEQPLRVLMVEDSPDDAELVLRQLKRAGYQPTHRLVETAEDMEKALQEQPWNLILCDYQLPRFDGLAAISLLQKEGLDIPLIIVSGVISTEMAVGAMKAGASDYIMKDNLSRLVPAIERELKEAEIRKQARLAEAQREATLAQLRESEEKYRFLTEQLTDTVWMVDIATLRPIYVSPATTTITGFTPEERLSQSLQDMMTPESFEAVTETLARELEREQEGSADPERVITLEMEYYHKDGHRIWMENTVRAIRNRDGKVQALHGVSRDITQRKKAEQDARESHQRLLTILNSISAVIYVADMETYEILFINDYGQSIWGDVRGQICWKTIQSGQSGPCHFCTNHLLVDKDGNPSGIYRWEFQNTLTGGWFDCQDSGIRWIDGRLVRLEVAIDITDRKKSEEVIRQSEERFRLFAELAPVGIIIADQDQRVLYANRKFMELFGYDGKNLSSIHSWWSLAYPDESLRKRIQALWQQDMEKARAGKEEIAPREFPVTSRDGKVRQIEFRMTATDDLILLVCSDMTDRKVLESQLSRAQKLESVGTLAGGIAHDFNNLLMGIQGYTSLMLLDLPPSHPHFERLKHIEQQVASGADLTKQLLGFARGERFEVKVTSMNDIVEKTATMFGRTKKEITIHSKLEPRLWNVEVDRTQMEQVLINLCVNAWQAMPGGGDLHLETGNILLDEDDVRPFDLEPGPYVSISVTDTGIGMDEWTRERIFDPFFTTKPKGRGTGLGLASTYGIIRGHRGMIHVYSEPGVGSRFSIYLPVSTKEAEDEGIEKTRTLSRGEETILLVDDEATVRDVSRELMESLGYRVHTASNGQEAIALYMEKRGEIDLVVLDLIMPGISGGETFDRLREIDPGIKIILASGYSIDGEAAKIVARGCDAFLQKPFLLAQLSGAIRNVLDRKQSL